MLYRMLVSVGEGYGVQPEHASPPARGVQGLAVRIVALDRWPVRGQGCRLKVTCLEGVELRILSQGDLI